MGKVCVHDKATKCSIITTSLFVWVGCFNSEYSVRPPVISTVQRDDEDG